MLRETEDSLLTTLIHDRPLKERFGDFDDLINSALTHLILWITDRLELDINFDIGTITIGVFASHFSKCRLLPTLRVDHIFAERKSIGRPVG
jgi:hypothetical protein